MSKMETRDGIYQALNFKNTVQRIDSFVTDKSMEKDDRKSKLL